MKVINFKTGMKWTLGRGVFHETAKAMAEEICRINKEEGGALQMCSDELDAIALFAQEHGGNVKFDFIGSLGDEAMLNMSLVGMKDEGIKAGAFCLTGWEDAEVSEADKSIDALVEEFTNDLIGSLGLPAKLAEEIKAGVAASDEARSNERVVVISMIHDSITVHCTRRGEAEQAGVGEIYTDGDLIEPAVELAALVGTVPPQSVMEAVVCLKS